MCARRTTTTAIVVVFLLALSGCASPERTGTSFCRQLARELPAIGQPIATTDEVTAMVGRYERLLERAPLSIEGDLAVLTELLSQASKVNATDTIAVQKLADATYAANQSSLRVRDWIKSTCAVDISTGLNIEPPRVAPTTTVVPVDGVTTTVPSK
ncbi:MAG: hypothetical protein ACOVK5_03870 [Ilumatobacteraceae bacterium]|jgi:hypothetical protein